MAKGAYIGVNTKIYTNSIGDLAVGSVIKINENGSPVDYIVVHQGNPDSSMYDASCDGTWVLRKDIYANTVWRGSYSNVYKSSYINSYLSSTFFNVLDSNIQSAIVEAVIPYVDGYGSSGTIRTGADGLSTKVFLLSGCEVGFSTSSYSTTLPVDGVKLDYFSSSDNTTRIAYLNGTATYWWCRTPNKAGTYNVFRVTSSGTADYNPPDVSIGVRPAFILPSTLSLTNNVVTGAEASYTTQSVARKIKGGYIGIEGEVYPNSVGLLPVGSTVKINENGSPVDYLVVHHGNPNPTMYDASCDGTWVLRKDIFSEDYWDTNGSNDYENSTIHPYLNGDFFDLFDSDIKSAIKQVKIPYREGARVSSSIASGSNGLSTKIFLLSGYEVGWTTSDNSYLPVDGAKLDYFLSGTTTDAKNLRIAYLDGTVTPWWLRSPSTGSGYFIGAVNVGGNLSNSVLSDSRAGYGIRPAFILPSSLKLTNGVVTGAQAEYVTQGIARKIKKAYIGVGGVARPFWSGGELTYYGTTSSTLGYAVAYHSAANNPNYGIFAGGSTKTTYRNYVYAYNSSLTRSAPSSKLPISLRNMTGGSIGNYALFAGGSISSTYYNTVTSYNTALTRGAPTSLTNKLIAMSSASNGTYVMFAGGRIEGEDPTDIVYCYNKSLTQSTRTLSSAKGSVAGASIGGYFLFAGGYVDGFFKNEVEVFDASLTKLATNTLPTQTGREDMLSNVVGGYALFAGGDQNESTLYKNVYAFNSSLTKTTATSLSQNRYEGCSASVDGFALFAGGRTNASYARYSTATVDVYDDSLTRTIGTDMSVNRYRHAATSIGNYALIGGGFNYVADVGTNEVNSVDVYTVV